MVTLPAVAVYGTAAAFDWRTRTVPNVLWIGAAAWFLLDGVPLAALVGAALVGGATAWAWRTGELGGADVKGLAILPLGLPSTWGLALLATAVGLLLAFRVGGRDEVPVFVVAFVGVAIASAATATV